MGKLLNIVQRLHRSTKRDYLERMNNHKVYCMNIARKFGFHFWDGKRNFGYGGHKYILDRWSAVADLIIKKYRLKNNSKILDVGCGKGYLLYEIKKKLPTAEVIGFDISTYAINNSKPEISLNLFVHNAKNKFPFEHNKFDLVISLACLHNLKIFDLVKSLKEIQRVGKKSYVMVESYRNCKELFNLQCWALTAESFFDPKEWEYIFHMSNYEGDYEFIYF